MQNQEPKSWKSVEPGMWKAEKEGDTVTGILVSITPSDEKYGNRYYLDTTEGIKLVWGSTVLDDRMKLVKIGQFVRITYKGKAKNAKKQDVNIFKVEVGEN